MLRFMVLASALLGWAFYELSGGAEFAPPEVIAPPRITHTAPPPSPAIRVEPIPEIVRASYAVPVVTAPSEFDAAAREAEVAPPAEIRTVAGRRVNMRAGPGTDHRVLTVLTRGETAEVLALDGRWARIRAGEREGWMALSMLSEAG